MQRFPNLKCRKNDSFSSHEQFEVVPEEILKYIVLTRLLVTSFATIFSVRQKTEFPE